MEEEEETDYFFQFSKPYMRLWEEEENSFSQMTFHIDSEETKIRRRQRPAEVTLEADSSHSPWDDLDNYRYCHVHRFFDSLGGFYKGDLDLTGRHPERLTSLLSLLNDLKSDLEDVRRTAKVVHYEEEDWQGRLQTCITHEMTDKDLWTKYRLKWKFPRLIDFTCLEDRLERLRKTMESNGNQPKLQKMGIFSLPFEILDHIVSHASLQQARLLAATCKGMRKVGMRYLFHTRCLAFEFGNREQRLKLIRDQPNKRHFQKLVVEKRRKLLQETSFLLSRSDLTQALQSLTIHNQWQTEARLLDNFHPSMLGGKFWVPINRALNNLLNVAQNLVTLTLHSIAISGDWLRTLSRLPALHSICFHCAFIDDESLETNLLHGRFPLCHQVKNLRIVEAPDEQDELSSAREIIGAGIWHTILLFPALMTFNHQRIYKMGGCVPRPEIREKSNLFSSGLRRLVLDNMFWDQIPSLTAWINSTCHRTGAACTLTHLKLQTYRPIGDNMVIPFLESLQSAPLEVLVLIGIKEGSLTLFRRIAQLFPDLLGLTLIRRENRCQKETKAATWPHQSWEYAAQFEGFHRLRYFGWNFAVPLFDVTPCAMLAFESDFASYEDFKDEKYFGDVQDIARPFAVRCPTLTIMALEHGVPYYCLVSRSPREEIIVQGEFNSPPGHDRGEWNPYYFELGWNPVPPPQPKGNVKLFV
ncbi:hypothetical protein VKT23_008536 [Stygiomarasmius scandens]|uniref:F-box domain-containing protein n=1 Tax=Marasmiellus scandens TaxID=2682957 RepID=A0ABR1JJI1_9AGAR